MNPLANPRPRTLAFVLVLAFASILALGCNEESSPAGPVVKDSDPPAAEDSLADSASGAQLRLKFIGTWVGMFGCPGNVLPDTMKIRAGTGSDDFSIVLHAQHWLPDTVTGTLQGANTIVVPEQTIGGLPGTGVFTHDGEGLAYSQTAILDPDFSITCPGTGYTRLPE